MMALARTEELTKKMKKITENYVDLVEEHMECAKNWESCADSKGLSCEIEQLGALYDKIMCRMQPVNTGIYEERGRAYIICDVAAIAMSVVAIVITLLSI